MAGFDTSDIVEVAIRIEENGMRFYRHAAGIAKSPEVKALFSRLSEDEAEHRRTFAGILSDLAPSIPPEGYDPEYAAYLHSYVDNILVFKTDALAAELAKIRDEAAALDFAIARELDSVHYYQDVLGMLPAGQRGAIEAIITEEKRHFTILSAEKQRLVR